jgi:hypothetical protein
MKTQKVRLHHYGRRGLFDTRACAEGFKEDRIRGLIYGPYWLSSLNRFAINAEEASIINRFCPYCGTCEGAPRAN